MCHFVDDIFQTDCQDLAMERACFDDGRCRTIPDFGTILLVQLCSSE